MSENLIWLGKVDVKNVEGINIGVVFKVGEIIIILVSGWVRNGSENFVFIVLQGCIF